MDTQPYLRSQTELLADCEARLRDTGNARWSDAEIYRALNDALLFWNDRVSVPHIYTITGGWLSNTFEYSLPNYVRPPLRAEVRRPMPYQEFGVNAGTVYNWQVIPTTTEPDGAGGLKLRLEAQPHTLEGRVVWMAPNSRMPTTVPTTSGSTDAAATSMVLGSAVDCDSTGYVKVNAEWLFYAGVTRAASTTTLLNLVRGLYGTTAATHSTSSSAAWGVAMDDLSLLRQLYDQAFAYLHSLYLTDAAQSEKSTHEKMMLHYQQRADAFWQTYAPKRQAPKFLLTRKVLIRA